MGYENGLYRPSRVQLEDGNVTEISDKQLDIEDLQTYPGLNGSINGSVEHNGTSEIGFDVVTPHFLGSIATNGTHKTPKE